jgi:hypothetical protein
MATADNTKYDALKTLDDYTKLYLGEWRQSAPNGPAPGIESNYTQDLVFSMERLATSPFKVKRLDPSVDILAFEMDALDITGVSLHDLFNTGRLFYADYRDQGSLEPSSQYSAACDAYFFIDQISGNFLPLAIRTNVNASLIYTPADDAADWLLAKIMLNVNDFWFNAWHHLAATHQVVQIVYMAAFRTLSDDHPVLALLNRLTSEVFAYQPFAESLLYANGTASDTILGYTGASAENYTSALYFGDSGKFQTNYFKTDLRTRGLIDSTCGPALKHFPFYEDASAIWDAIHEFMSEFVASYYLSDLDLLADDEIQAWVGEANEVAKVRDFPRVLSSRVALVGVLTHMVCCPK